MSRDPSAPIEYRPGYKVRRDRCGYALADQGGEHCGQPSAYQFHMAAWPSWRVGNTCPEHAQLIRTWDGVAWMRTLAGVR